MESSVRVLPVFLLWWLVLCSRATRVLALCADDKDCFSCASDTSWSGSNCRWCEIDRACHEFGDLDNPCHVVENIDNATLCGCSSDCTPAKGVGSEVCTWYTNSSGDPGPDPATWQGGDFLPVTYGSAADCACSGDGNVLWNTTVTGCIRQYLISGHVGLPADVKIACRNATLSGDYDAFLPYIGVFYQMHVDAYEACCCPGTPAPYVDWVGIFYAGNLLPCDGGCDGDVGIIPFILEFGRCGCGW